MDDEREVNGPEKDPEVKQLVEQSKMLFLRQVMDEFRDKQAQYNLEEEFSKTRKNRSPFVPLVVLGIVVVFVGAMVGVTWYIQQSSQDIRISIEEFEDVNLREILDGAQRLQNQLDNARRRLQTTIAERDDAIQSARAEAQRQINIVRNQDISQGQRNSRIASIEAQAEDNIESIREEYAGRIEEIRAEITNLEDQIAQ